MRFGLFDGEVIGDETGWVGYYMANKHGNPGTPPGLLGYKTVGNASLFLSITSGAASLQTQQGDGTAASLFNDGTYDLMMSIERNAAGELVLNSSIVGVGDRPPVEPYDPQNPPPSPGPNQFSQIMSATHSTASTTGTYTFDSLGFWSGGNLDADHLEFINLDVTFFPGRSGDFNDDGVVDAADYVLWRKSPIIHHGGYESWRANFGANYDSGSAQLDERALPESTSILVLIQAALLLASSGRANSKGQV